MSSVIKKISVLVSGSVLSQILTIAVLPLLTRMYTPEDFALLAKVTTLSLLISIVLTLRLEVSIVLPRSNLVSRKIHSVVSLFVVFTSTFIFVISIPIVEFFGVFHQALIVAAFLSIINITINNSIRMSNYRKIAKIKLFQVISTIFFQVVFFTVFEFELGLVWGYILGVFLTSLIFYDYDFFMGFPKLNFIIYTLNRYRDFPLYNASQALVNSFSGNLLIFSIGSLFSNSILGQYSIANRAIQTPMSILSSSIKQVLFKHISDTKNNRSPVYKNLMKQTCTSALVPIIPFFVYYLYSVEIITFVFGEQWALAGELSCYLLFWFYFVFVSTPVTAAIQVYGLQKSFLIYEVLVALIRMLFFGLASFYNISPSDFVLWFSLIGAFANFLLIIFVTTKLKGVDDDRRNINISQSA
ncbi:oligosaccharide flippase family protein [Vibrio harveyi]|uniref:oligosaccharide flippase family protein n=1 Tax=Vibrio harveyi TaxID=669 RepID=UPI00406844DF